MNRSLGTALENNPLLGVTEVDKLDKLEPAAVWGDISNERTFDSKIPVLFGSDMEEAVLVGIKEGTIALPFGWVSDFSFGKLRKSRNSCFCLTSFGAAVGVSLLSGFFPSNDSIYYVLVSI